MREELKNLYDLGFNIIPIKNDKRSRIGWGLYQTKRISEKIIPLIETSYGVGFVCGAISNIVVVDCDTLESIEWLEKQPWHIPSAIEVKTRRGKHYYYRVPKGKQINTTRYENGEIKIDLKAEKSIVVCPPTPNYSWEKFTLDLSEVPELSDEYINHIKPMGSSKTNNLLEVPYSKVDYSEFDKVVQMFEPKLKLGEIRPIYVKDAFNMLQSKGIVVIKENAGPMKSDNKHINGYVIFEGHDIRFFSYSTKSCFALVRVPLETQFNIITNSK